MLGIGQQTPYEEIHTMTLRKEPYDRLWRAAVKFHKEYDKWMNGPVLEVNAEVVEEEVCQSVCTVVVVFYRFWSWVSLLT